MRPRTLIVLFALISAAPAAAQDLAPTGAATVVVRLSSFRFSPKVIALEVAKPYRLRLENVSSDGHSFAAEPFFASTRLAPEDQAKIKHGRVEVEAGQSVDLHVVPMRTGEFRFHCTHFLHSVFGMTGTITVQ